VCRSRLLSEPPPSSLPLTLPASEFEFEIEPPKPNSGSSCIPPSRLPNSSAARLDPPPIFPGPLALLRAGRLRDELILLAPILAEPLDWVDPTELIEPTLAPDSLVLLSAAIAEPALRGRGVRASISSTSGLPLPRRGGESEAADGTADSGKVGPNGVVGSSSASARLFVVETVDVEAADASEARDDADASESSEGRRMLSYSSSSSCVLIVVVVANDAVEVVDLLFPPNVSIVSMDVFEPVEPSVSRLSLACGFGTTCLFMFADAPAGYGTISGTAGNALGLNGIVSVALPLLGVVAALA
jgi:hypothetical protein